jgi:hypothetical protein
METCCVFFDVISTQRILKYDLNHLPLQGVKQSNELGMWFVILLLQFVGAGLLL